MGVEECSDLDRGLSRTALATIRGILISSLSKENLGPVDATPPPVAPTRRHKRRVTFNSESIKSCLNVNGSGAPPLYDDTSRDYESYDSISLDDSTGKIIFTCMGGVLKYTGTFQLNGRRKDYQLAVSGCF